MKKFIYILTLMIFIIGVGIGTYYFFFMPNNKVVAAFEEGKLNLVVEGNVINSKAPPRLVNEEILLPIEIVKKYIDPYIYWDSKLKKVTVTTKDKVIRMKTDSLNALVNNKPVTLNIPVSITNNTVYIPIDFLSDFYNIQIKYIKGNNVIVIDYKKGSKKIALPLKSKIVVRSGRSIHYPILEKINIDKKDSTANTLKIFGDYNKWYKVRTSNGVVGFIEKRFVTEKLVQESTISTEDNNQITWKPLKGKINLVWDEFWRGKSTKPDLSKMKGLDVISPTWFQIANAKGDITNIASARYVDWAHQNGLKVWALIRNDSGDINTTSEFLNNTDSRDNTIRQILTYAALYKLDGINIDFENIKKSDKDALTQFVREITPFLKEQGLVVSIDVTVPDGSANWSMCYDRSAFGQVVDYVMLMTYDEYWSTSPVAGPVAEIGWVERNLQNVIESVPKEKLLLGIPFYTREWEEKSDDGGGLKLVGPAKTLNMDSVRKIIEENNAIVKWDSLSGQYFTEFKKNDSTYEIWIENSSSINLKSSLVQKYSLAGACSWRKDFETSDIWDVLNNNLKLLNNYDEWLNENKEVSYSYK